MKYINIVLVLLVSLMISCEEIISVPDISEDSITLQSPAGGVEVETSQVTFSWLPVEFATSYRLQVATPSFTQATSIVLDTIIIDSMGDVRLFQKELPSGLYEWRMKAENSSFETMYSISNFSISLEDLFIDSSVVIIEPVDALSTSETDINIQWEPVDMALEYRVRVVNSDTSEVILDQTAEDVSIEVSFPDSGNYTYQIRAETAFENTMFTTQTIVIE